MPRDGEDDDEPADDRDQGQPIAQCHDASRAAPA
jgi:hypothetical protein